MHGRGLRHRRRAAARHRRRVDRRAGHPLQARRRRPEPVADPADHGGRVRVRASGWRCARSRSAPGCSRSTSALGETAVLGAFVAQDLALFVLFFDLMLVPFYFLVGQWGGPDRVAGGAEDGHLHARRLAADARRARWPRRCSSQARAGRPDHASCSPTCAATRCRSRRRSGSSSTFALAFLIKMPAFPFHGWMPDAYRDDAAAGAGVLLRRGLEGRRLRLPAARAAAVPGRDRGLPRRSC